MDDFSSNLEESKEVDDCAVHCGFSGAKWDQSASRNEWIKGLSAINVEICFVMPVGAYGSKQFVCAKYLCSEFSEV
jgi:hypothetical protein